MDSKRFNFDSESDRYMTINALRNLENTYRNLAREVPDTLGAQFATQADDADRIARQIEGE